ncbi:hypothetical protein CGZ69_18450 [Streptomyces peucetius subsp. caesius ATCC 27952]|nr:hypothetical protein CGZ69_18450 [Streptomyces peucetius subsp. caesius ATCC 27952]
MGLLTIGAFARVSRLSAKALRRYDEMGLLRPVRVDPFTGYRYYDEAQSERARLVAWLRRIGMPLARIGEVCDLAESDASGRAGQRRLRGRGRRARLTGRASAGQAGSPRTTTTGQGACWARCSPTEPRRVALKPL